MFSFEGEEFPNEDSITEFVQTSLLKTMAHKKKGIAYFEGQVFSLKFGPSGSLVSTY